MVDNYIKLVSSGDEELSHVGIIKYGGSTYTLMRGLSEEGFRQISEGDIDCAGNCNVALRDLREYMKTRFAHAPAEDRANRTFRDVATSFDCMLVETINKLCIGIKKSMEAAA